CRIVGIRLERQGELQGGRDVIARPLRGAQRLRIAQRLTIGGLVGGPPDATIVPWRPRVPPGGEVEGTECDAPRESRGADWDRASPRGLGAPRGDRRRRPRRA